MIPVNIHISRYYNNRLQLIVISHVYVVSFQKTFIIFVFDNISNYVFRSISSDLFQFKKNCSIKRFTSKSLIKFLESNWVYFGLYSGLKMSEDVLAEIIKGGKYKTLQIIDYDSYNRVS